MDSIKDQQYNAVKVVLLIVVIALVGWFIVGKTNTGLKGQILSEKGPSNGFSTDLQGPNVVCNGNKPSLTFVSPRSGQVINVGVEYIFKWVPCNLPANGIASLSLINQQTGMNTYLPTDGLGINEKVFSFKINPYMESGSYLARVFCGVPNSESYCTEIGSEDFTGSFTVNAPVLSPSITSTSATSITSESAQINIDYSKNDGQPSTSQVHYGIGNTNSVINGATLGNTVSGTMTVMLTNLNPNTTYTYNGTLSTPTYGTTLSTNKTFTTLP